ncbi:MAG: serine hydrolase [Rhodothalassiaceae bacterium]
MIPARRSLILALAVFCGLPAIAGADETEATLQSYAAGYKAGFVCSAHFNAGKDYDAIVADELSGIYPEIADRVAALPAPVIDEENRRVSVAWSDRLPPRIAQWRPRLGCVHLPVGGDMAMADALKDIPLPPRDPARERTDDGAPWSRHAVVNGPSGNDALDAAIARAFTGGYGHDAKTSAILIADREAILAERYAPGFSPTMPQRTWSVAKSILASVIGAAIAQDLIALDEPAPIPEWSRPHDPRRAITLAHLLQMASGLDSDRAGNRTDRLYMGGGLVTETATAASLETAPGTRWKYANNDTLLAARALRAAIGDDAAYLAFPFETLLDPLGMTHSWLETDWDGNFILSSQVWTTARDLARLGLLYLDDGVWNGRRLLAEGWVRYVATPAPAQPPLAGPDGSPRPGYGAQWWLSDSRFPGLPDGVFSARGNRGQYLVIVPSAGLVIVRRGYDPAGGEGFAPEAFVADVLAALDAE